MSTAISSADLYVYHGSEIMRARPDGCVYRPQNNCLPVPSGQWQIIGAVEMNNFGQIVRRWTWEQICADPGAIPWQWKNGKQRTHVVDLDHGTRRVWMNPTHRISKGA